MARGELQRARELAEQYFPIAQNLHIPFFSLWAHYCVGEGSLYGGEFVAARNQLEQGIAFCQLKEFSSTLVPLVQDPGVASFSQAALALWVLGYPDQALQRVNEALTLAQKLSHPFSLAWAHCHVARQHQLRREAQLSGEWAEKVIALCTEQGFAFWLAQGKILQGWALAEQGQAQEGIARIQQGIEDWKPTRAEMWRPYYLGQLAEAPGRAGNIKEGLAILTEALTAAEKYQMCWLEAELHRLKGELILNDESRMVNAERQTQQAAEAEHCFQTALDIARRQEAKAWELRAAISLARLWQQQGKVTEARELLTPVYNWFTEGFDTKDLQEAKALLEELSKDD